MKAGEGDDRMRCLDGITDEFEQAPGDSEGQGSLACCIPWGNKESDTMERLNNNTKIRDVSRYPSGEIM